MDTKAALKWTLYYRGVAWASGLVGIGFALLGLKLSNGALPLSWEGITQAAASVEFAVLGLIGFSVWQVGKTAAYYKTLTEATDDQLAERFDPELIKSDVLSVLDERLAEMHTDLEATRRGVEELETSDAGNFELDD